MSTPIPKLQAGVPDSYGVTITFITTRVKEYRIVRHEWVFSNSAFSFQTIDNERHVVPLSSVCDILFDKDFETLLAAQKLAQKEAKK